MNMKTVTLDNGKTVSFDAKLPTVDDGLAFYVSQLTAFESRWYETKYPGIDFQELVPINTSTPEWADDVAFRMYDGVTMGKFIGANADDLPRVAVEGKMFKAPIGYAGNAFEYSLDELRKASHVGMPLDDSLARLARRGAEEHIQRVVYFGDAERGMTGLFNNANIPFSNSTLDWYDPATTPLEIVADINRILTQIYTQTKGVATADTLVLPAARWAFLTTTFASAQFPDKTILDLVRERNVFKARTGRDLTIVPRFQLNQEELPNYIPGYTDGDIIMAFERTSENLEAHVPMPWRPTAPQPRNLKIHVPCEYKCSGTVVRYPLTAVYSKQVKRT